MCNQTMDSQISLAYWTNCKDASIIQWPDITFLTQDFLTTFILLPCDILFQLDFDQNVKHKSWTEMGWHSITKYLSIFYNMLNQPFDMWNSLKFSLKLKPFHWQSKYFFKNNAVIMHTNIKFTLIVYWHF